MKSFFILLAFTLFTTTSVHADFRKDLYESVKEEIQNYYSAGGEWSVVKIKDVEEVEARSSEYKIMKAKVNLQSFHTEKASTQTCIVTFAKDNYEFYAINCF